MFQHLNQGRGGRKQYTSTTAGNDHFLLHQGRNKQGLQCRSNHGFKEEGRVAQNVSAHSVPHCCAQNFAKSPPDHCTKNGRRFVKKS
jgi:hypothetical protein